MSLGKGLESLIPPKRTGVFPPVDDGVSRTPSEGSAPQNASLLSDESPVTEDEESFISTPEPELPPFIEDKPAVSPPPMAVEPQVKQARFLEESPRQIDSVFHIEVDKIFPNPFQPRREFDDTAIQELAASIREFGILQPLVVTKVVKEVPTGTTVEYQLIAGERRLMAAKKLGLERVPAIIKVVDLEKEKLELAIIENLQRENLNPIEMGRAYARLQDDFHLTQREIATRLGKSREVVANTLRLLDLPLDIQDAVARGDISESHGRLLLSVADPAARERLFKDLLGRRVSTRELRERVDRVKPQARQTSLEVPPEIKHYEDRLASELGTPVRIQPTGDGGKITISFFSREELQELLRKMGKREGGREL